MGRQRISRVLPTLFKKKNNLEIKRSALQILNYFALSPFQLLFFGSFYFLFNYRVYSAVEMGGFNSKKRQLTYFVDLFSAAEENKCDWKKKKKKGVALMMDEEGEGEKE